MYLIWYKHIFLYKALIHLGAFLLMDSWSIPSLRTTKSGEAISTLEAI